MFLVFVHICMIMLKTKSVKFLLVNGFYNFATLELFIVQAYNKINEIVATINNF